MHSPSRKSIHLYIPFNILICHGDEGISLQQKNTFLIHLYQLQSLNRKQILDFFNKSYSPSIKPVNLITKNRHLYLDILLMQDLPLIILNPKGHNQKQLNKVLQTKFKLPLQLQIIYPNNNYKIQSQTKISLKYFNILKKIGQGTFAEIFLAELKYNKELVTIKRINKQEHKKKGTKQMLFNQFQTLKHRHQHKINLSYMFQDNAYLYYVCDYCTGGNLYTYIQKQSQILSNRHPSECVQCQIFTKQEKYWIFIQFLIILVYLHENGIIYRDIKPENIIIDQRGFVKLCDFGYCTKYEKGQVFKQLCGTLQYIPPELILKQQYDKGIDLYGAGILFYELLANKTPFTGITLENMKQKKSQAILFNKKIFTDQQKELIKLLTKQVPTQRLGYQNSLYIFNHSFFTQSQVLFIIKSIISRKPNELFIHKIKYEQKLFQSLSQIKQYQRQSLINSKKQDQHFNSYPEQQYQETQIENKQNQKLHSRYFDGQYNYLKPTFEIDQKIGPKFMSNY